MNNKTAARERLFLVYIHFPMYLSAADPTPMQNVNPVNR